MSFYINNPNPTRPGPLRNAGPGCICERVCIETTRVFDACISQVKEIGVQLLAIDFIPPTPQDPLTFISAHCDSENIIVSNVIIDRLPNNNNFANVSCDITVPVTITFVDANNVTGSAVSQFTISRSAVLFVPQPAIMPVNVKVVASCDSLKGSYLGNNIFSVDFCIVIILKIIATVDLLIPSFGYCPIPLCNEIDPICPGFPTTPIFPTAGS